jgi:hypothetical protein
MMNQFSFSSPVVFVKRSYIDLDLVDTSVEDFEPLARALAEEDSIYA